MESSGEIAGFRPPLVHSFGGASPAIDPDAFVAPGAVIVGDVRIGRKVSIWHGCILRGDIEFIEVGDGSNVQDGSVIHADPGFPVRVGSEVLIGHMALLHGCTIHDHGFVGMGAIVMNGATIETNAMLAAGAMLTEGRVAKTGQLWAGRPAKHLRDLTPAEIEGLGKGIQHYIVEGRVYREFYARSALRQP